MLTKQMKLFLLLIPVMAITGGASLASIAVLLGAALPMTAIAYDEQSKWNELAVMMPYSKRNIVLSKYLLGYLGMAGAAIVFIAAQLIVTAIQRGSGHENLDLISFSILSGLLLIAVNTPIQFKFGVQKGRFVFIVFMGLAAAGSSIVKDLQIDIPMNLAGVLPVVLFLAVILINVVSIHISLHLKQT